MTSAPTPQDTDYDGDAIVHVRTDLPKEDLAELVATALGGTVEQTAWGITGVTGQCWDIALSANPVTGEPDDDFVNWPWQIEYETTASPQNPTDPAQDIGTLLQALWSAGHWAVAACDYEHLLPNSGGWHAGHYIGQPSQGTKSI